MRYAMMCDRIFKKDKKEWTDAERLFYTNLMSVEEDGKRP